MLLLGSQAVTVEGIQVFKDHADPNQFWYLPGPVSLARNPQTRQAIFTFLKYRPAAVAGGAKGGGFLIFVANLQLDPHLEQRILGKVSALCDGEPKLSAVQFDEGTVECVALNLAGAGGTAATDLPGTFTGVRKILGSTVPSLFGDNAAAFSLTLDQEGATIFEQAFKDLMTPVQVIYALKFTGMRPALDVKITVDYKRVFDQFSAGLSATYYFVTASIEAGFEKLVQSGAIKIEVTNYTGAADLAQKEQWALDFFKAKLMADWFEPSLLPGQFAGGGALGLDQATRGGAVRPPTPAAPPKPPALAGALGAGGTPAAAGGTPTADGATPAAAGATPAAVGGAPPAGPAPTAGSGKGKTPAPNPVRLVTKPAAGAPPAGPTGAPSAPVARPQAAGAGLGFNPASPTNAQNGLANTGSSGLQIALRLKYIHQEELKTMTFEYQRSEATQRLYGPVGQLGLLASDLEQSNHFMEIDLDDPFFRVFTVTVQAPIDFAHIGLTSAHVSLDYGDATDPATVKHQDFIFDAAHKQDQQWQVFLSKSLDTSYRYSVEYHFDPGSPWKAKTYDYQFPKTVTEDRNLFLNPYNQLAFLEVKVFPNRIDKDEITSTDVNLSYTSPSGWSRQDVITVVPGKDAQYWRLRLEDQSATTYSYYFVHHLADGSTIQTDPVQTAATSLPVDDPFPGALDLTLVPMLDSSKVRYAFFDLDYEEPGDHYKRTLRLQFDSNSAAPVEKHISLRDPRAITFKYRLTFEGKNGQEQRGPFVETQDTLIAIKQGG